EPCDNRRDDADDRMSMAVTSIAAGRDSDAQRKRKRDQRNNQSGENILPPVFEPSDAVLGLFNWRGCMQRRDRRLGTYRSVGGRHGIGPRNGTNVTGLRYDARPAVEVG